jgi:two-component system, OmpR family, alkaline phosphatase synthesis response regulator PhoP
MKTRGAASQHSMRSAFSRAVNEDLIGLSAAHGGIRRIVCECSRRMCTELLDVTVADYEAVRAHPTRLLVVPGHELADVQRVVSQTRRVAVVQEQQECLRMQSEATNGFYTDNGKRPRVLIVEDEPFMCRLWAINLRAAGLYVLEAPDGFRGLARARSERPDLVTTDVMMRGLDGFQLAEALGQDEHTRRIPLIFLSGRAETAAADRAYGLGAVAYLSKSSDLRAAASLVAGVLARFARDDPELVA